MASKSARQADPDSLREGYLSRIEAATDTAASRTNHSAWVQKHTTLQGDPFNFKHHEMQVDIFDDPASRIAVRKCSQVGLSELQVRKLLTISAVMRYVRVIYTLPTRQFAMRFAKDRVDTTIEQAPMIYGMLKRGSDSAEQKVFTNGNVLYVTGTYGDNSAISVPATYIVNDELDFSNQEVVSKMSSRLRHAEENEDGYRGFHYKFSTPTLPGFGVTKEFEKGDQKYYACRCSRCNHDNIPGWYTHFTVPGYDGDMREFDAQTATPLIDSDKHLEAYIRCSKCGKNLWDDLINPARRRWVAKYPDRKYSSYQVSPWDVPHYNKPSEIVLQMKDYTRHMDFMNFVVGLDYQDSDSVFSLEPFNDSNDTKFVRPDKVAGNLWLGGHRLCAGMDVGKVCHFMVGYPTETGMKVVYAEEIKHTAQAPGKQRLFKLLKMFNIQYFVMDSGPDITLVRDALEFCKMHGIRAFASEYVRTVGLENFQPNPETQIVKVNRTETLTQLMKSHNTRNIQYPAQGTHPVMYTVKNQVTALKKIVREVDSGEMLEQFVKTGPDHFGHTMNYLNIAVQMASGGLSMSSVVGANPMVKRIKMRGGSSRDTQRRLYGESYV